MPAPLLPVVFRATRHEVEDRYSSAEDMAADLARCAQQLGVASRAAGSTAAGWTDGPSLGTLDPTAGPPVEPTRTFQAPESATVPDPAPPEPRSSKNAVWAAVLGVVAAGGGLAWWGLSADPSAPEPRPAPEVELVTPRLVVAESSPPEPEQDEGAQAEAPTDAPPSKTLSSTPDPPSEPRTPPSEPTTPSPAPENTAKVAVQSSERLPANPPPSPSSPLGRWTLTWNGVPTRVDVRTLGIQVGTDVEMRTNDSTKVASFRGSWDAASETLRLEPAESHAASVALELQNPGSDCLGASGSYTVGRQVMRVGAVEGPSSWCQ